MDDVRCVVSARKKTHPQTRARRCKRLLSTERLIQRIAGILLCPYAGHTGSTPALKATAIGIGSSLYLGQCIGCDEIGEDAVNPVHGHRTAAFRHAVKQTGFGKKRFLVIAGTRNVSVTRRCKTKLIGVLHALRLEHQTVAKRFPNIASLLFAVDAGPHSKFVDLKISPLIVGG